MFAVEGVRFGLRGLVGVGLYSQVELVRYVGTNQNCGDAMCKPYTSVTRLVWKRKEGH